MKAEKLINSNMKIWKIGLGLSLFLAPLFTSSLSFDHDVAVIEIFMPDTVFVDSTYKPKAKVQNFGAFVESFYTKCNIHICGAPIVIDFFAYTENLYPDSTSILEDIPPYTPWKEGKYIFRLHTYLENDENPENDTLSKKFYAIPTGIEEKTVAPVSEFRVWPSIGKEFSVYSNRPITAYNVLGQKVKNLEPGLQKVIFDSAGVYFLKSGDEVRKVVEVK